MGMTYMYDESGALCLAHADRSPKGSCIIIVILFYIGITLALVFPITEL